MFEKNETPPSFYSFMNSNKKIKHDTDIVRKQDIEEALYDQSVRSWKAICLSGEIGGVTRPEGATLPNSPLLIELAGVKRWKLLWRSIDTDSPSPSNAIADPTDPSLSPRERQSLIRLHFPFACYTLMPANLEDTFVFGSEMNVKQTKSGLYFASFPSNNVLGVGGMDGMGGMFGPLSGLKFGPLGAAKGIGNWTGSDRSGGKAKKRTYLGGNPSWKNKVVYNGQLPDDILGKSTETKHGTIMIRETIPFFNQLAIAFKTKFGVVLKASGFRTFDTQVQLKKEKPKLAAPPGTSNHGWGLAFDWDPNGGGASGYGFKSDTYKWMFKNAPIYGFHNPEWAQETGSLPEWWHFEWMKSSQFFTKKIGSTHK